LQLQEKLRALADARDEALAEGAALTLARDELASKLAAEQAAPPETPSEPPVPPTPSQPPTPPAPSEPPVAPTLSEPPTPPAPATSPKPLPSRQHGRARMPSEFVVGWVLVILGAAFALAVFTGTLRIELIP